MKKKNTLTIYDLARELNYSTSTISRALKNHKSISKKTAQLIQRAAEERGYRPNSLAASLRSNNSKTIGVSISNISRPFVSDMISGIETSAREKGYNVIISQSHDSYDNEVSNAKALYDSRVCGIIASLSMQTENTDHFNQFKDQGIPVVFVDRVPNNFQSYHVIIDNYTSAYIATEHLIEQGCKRIAHFAGSQHLNVYSQRKKGFIEALKHHDLEIDERLIVDMKTLSFEEGAQVTAELFKLNNPPDGIFSSNDTAAVSAILYLKKQGIRIPDDVAVIGFNDDPISSIVEPALSTIYHPAQKMGELSTRRILEHLEKEDGMHTTEISVLETHVISRASSVRKKST
ncbi:LacI family DNA-binding transcriptional regulator [Leeuwenhoekiella marinoflava]|uniref:LacI family transcriptional regulator n=2 Tax=Leeuwenhoekiella marinoflava TaxID=988 RepID=A0A4Q0PQA2_9FLAO|nr:LacI family DNA-binding transcriptional regulator [Leeuwenhoekiella marinoflava]RXG32392.1 LacI family transcriptional regulator [Leeuwenhoekiella marinoflava]SHE73402.1 transcriptional regulator, LacI family [Leeuwenhoekiella marinoflava DSM 3653]